MKSLKITIILLIVSQVINAQITFNRIIEDTVSHITSGVIDVDTGYVLLTGSQNEFMVRTFALTYIGLTGKPQWKQTYTDSENELWEGFSNCLLSDENSPSMSGTIIDNNYDNYGVSLFVFDSLYHSHELNLYEYDTLWKKAFNIIESSNKDFYITGQNYNYDVDQYHMYLLKVNSVFELLWQKSYGNRYEGGSQIIETNDKNILVGGRTFSFPTTTTDEDWYLIKLDTAGNVIWET